MTFDPTSGQPTGISVTSTPVTIKTSTTPATASTPAKTSTSLSTTIGTTNTEILSETTHSSSQSQESSSSTRAPTSSSATQTTTTTSTKTTGGSAASESSSGSSVNSTAIAAAVVGGVVVLAIGGIAYYLHRRNQIAVGNMDRLNLAELGEAGLPADRTIDDEIADLEDRLGGFSAIREFLTVRGGIPMKDDVSDECTAILDSNLLEIDNFQRRALATHPDKKSAYEQRLTELKEKQSKLAGARVLLDDAVQAHIAQLRSSGAFGHDENAKLLENEVTTIFYELALGSLGIILHKAHAPALEQDPYAVLLDVSLKRNPAQRLQSIGVGAAEASAGQNSEKLFIEEALKYMGRALEISRTLETDLQQRKSRAQTEVRDQEDLLSQLLAELHTKHEQLRTQIAGSEPSYDFAARTRVAHDAIYDNQGAAALEGATHKSPDHTIVNMGQLAESSVDVDIAHQVSMVKLEVASLAKKFAELQPAVVAHPHNVYESADDENLYEVASDLVIRIDPATHSLLDRVDKALKNLAAAKIRLVNDRNSLSDSKSIYDLEKEQAIALVVNEGKREAEIIALSAANPTVEGKAFKGFEVRNPLAGGQQDWDQGVYATGGAAARSAGASWDGAVYDIGGAAAAEEEGTHYIDFGAESDGEDLVNLGRKMGTYEVPLAREDQPEGAESVYVTPRVKALTNEEMAKYGRVYGNGTSSTDSRYEEVTLVNPAALYSTPIRPSRPAADPESPSSTGKLAPQHEGGRSMGGDAPPPLPPRPVSSSKA